jgi:anti-anti-sigma regulatory factor
MPMRLLLVPTLLVASTGDRLMREARAAFAAGEHKVALDFSHNAYTDDAGQLMLVRIGRDARQAGTPLVLRNLPGGLSRSLAHSGLDTFFHIESTAGELAAAG